MLVCSLVFLLLVYMVFMGNCLARVEAWWAGDFACDFVPPNYEQDVLLWENLSLPFVVAFDSGSCHCFLLVCCKLSLAVV
jgi:hypothetical protein